MSRHGQGADDDEVGDQVTFAVWVVAQVKLGQG